MTWEYKDDILVGYRWTESKNIKPLFAFGHGLSYTTFEYSDAQISQTEITTNDSVQVSIKVRNTGSRAGSEVVQLYIADNKSSVARPVKELKGFCKLHLAPGETGEASFIIRQRDLSFYDDKEDKWTAEPGKFTIHIGAASDDIKASLSFRLR